MKYLGIDYGTKRIGVAVSDESAVMAFPLGTVSTGKGAVKEVLDIAKENGVSIAVMGESCDFQGKPNAIMKDIEHFAAELQAGQVAVVFESEVMTSLQAERQFNKLISQKPKTRERNKVRSPEHQDASAAALILQSYLDRRRK